MGTSEPAGRGRPEPDAYVNYGVLLGFANIPYLHMRLDTWYYKDVVDQIGQMDLGEASLSARNGLGVAATHWLAAWWEGFRGLALPLSVRASYIK